MDRIKVARKLVRMAKALVGAGAVWPPGAAPEQTDRYIIFDPQTKEYVESTIGSSPSNMQFVWTKIRANAGAYSRSTAEKHKKLLLRRDFTPVRMVQASMPRRAVSGGRLDGRIRAKANAALSHAGLDGNTYFEKPTKGYAKALDVLGRFGIELGTVVSSHVFNADSGRTTVDLAFSDPDDPFSPGEIMNSALVLSWQQMQSGRYEVLAYLS